MTRVQVALIAGLLLLVIVLEIRRARRRSDDADWPDDDRPAATRSVTGGDDGVRRAPKRARPAKTRGEDRSPGVARHGRTEGLPDTVFEPRGDASGAVFGQIKDVLDRMSATSELRSLIAANTVRTSGAWFRFDGNRWVRVERREVDESLRLIPPSDPDVPELQSRDDAPARRRR